MQMEEPQVLAEQTTPARKLIASLQQAASEPRKQRPFFGSPREDKKKIQKPLKTLKHDDQSLTKAVPMAANNTTCQPGMLTTPDETPVVDLAPNQDIPKDQPQKPAKHNRIPAL
jgi:hypothetical protein